jgi:magnesium-transporting ATPase (P-type)
MQAVFETAFDIVYLITVISLGIIMLKNSRGKKQYILFGIMAIVLGCGDSFHLVPRAIALCTTGLADYTAVLGIGKLITSITMTIFYLLLYYVWRERYEIKEQKNMTAIVWSLSIVRIILCLFPQNEWTSASPSLAWGIYRNIPFALLGLLIVILFFRSARQTEDQPFANLWLTIVISFACYLPVVLFAESYPLVGMLMIPKTCAYVWTVLIGYRALKGENK